MGALLVWLGLFKSGKSLFSTINDSYNRFQSPSNRQLDSLTQIQVS